MNLLLGMDVEWDKHIVCTTVYCIGVVKQLYYPFGKFNWNLHIFIKFRGLVFERMEQLFWAAVVDKSNP